MVEAAATRVGLELALVAALVALTWMVFHTYPRYEAVGGELLVDPRFEQGLDAWEVSGRGSARLENGTLVLRVHEPGAGVAVRQTLTDPGRYRMLRLSASVETRNVHAGPRFWHRARLVLASFDADRRMMAVPHLVADLDGTRGWRHYSAVFRIPDGAREVRAGPQLVGATGEMALRDLSLREVVASPGVFDFHRLVLALWGLLLVWIALPLGRSLRWRPSHGMLVMAVAMVLAGTLSPATWRMSIQSWAWQLYAALTGQQAQLQQGLALSAPEFGHAVHLLMFVLLTVACATAFRRQQLSVIALRVLGLAAITETLQFFIDGRQPRVSDFLADAIGVLTGVLLAWVWRQRSARAGPAGGTRAPG